MLKILQLLALTLALAVEFYWIMNVFVLVELMIMHILMNVNNVIILGLFYFEFYNKKVLIKQMIKILAILLMILTVLNVMNQNTEF